MVSGATEENVIKWKPPQGFWSSLLFAQQFVFSPKVSITSNWAHVEMVLQANKLCTLNVCERKNCVTCLTRRWHTAVNWECSMHYIIDAFISRRGCLLAKLHVHIKTWMNFTFAGKGFAQKNSGKASIKTAFCISILTSMLITLKLNIWSTFFARQNKNIMLILINI